MGWVAAWGFLHKGGGGGSSSSSAVAVAPPAELEVVSDQDPTGRL